MVVVVAFANSRFSYDVSQLSRVMRKPMFYICENKGTDHSDSIPGFSVSKSQVKSDGKSEGDAKLKQDMAGTDNVKVGDLKITVDGKVGIFSGILALYMSCVARKPVFGFSDQIRHKQGSTATEDG